MAFADRLGQEHHQPRGGITSYVDVALGSMSETDAAAALSFLSDPRRSNEVMAKMYTDEGHPMRCGAVRNWRKANKVGIYHPEYRRDLR